MVRSGKALIMGGFRAHILEALLPGGGKLTLWLHSTPFASEEPEIQREDIDSSDHVSECENIQQAPLLPSEYFPSH